MYRAWYIESASGKRHAARGTRHAARTTRHAARGTLERRATSIQHRAPSTEHRLGSLRRRSHGSAGIHAVLPAAPPRRSWRRKRICFSISACERKRAADDILLTFSKPHSQFHTTHGHTPHASCTWLPSHGKCIAAHRSQMPRPFPPPSLRGRRTFAFPTGKDRFSFAKEKKTKETLLATAQPT